MTLNDLDGLLDAGEVIVSTAAPVEYVRDFQVRRLLAREPGPAERGTRPERRVPTRVTSRCMAAAVAVEVSSATPGLPIAVAE
jgi:hypothetical protein